MSLLHSPSLQARYDASIRGGTRETPERWPLGCGGAANAYLVLIGPSMGRVTGRHHGVGNTMNLGPEAMNFDWGDHRKARWTRLCAAILGDECHAHALTALLNLSEQHSTNESEISGADLRAGWTERIWPVLRRVRPRIVCALTNSVWDTIVDTLTARFVEIPACPFDLARTPKGFRIPGCQFTTVLVKPHNHPSRFLSNEQVDQLGLGCRWLMNMVA
jgi:hypothetical protein